MSGHNPFLVSFDTAHWGLMVLSLFGIGLFYFFFLSFCIPLCIMMMTLFLLKSNLHMIPTLYTKQHTVKINIFLIIL